MTDKELRKLSRSELLELLIEQMNENEKLRLKLKKAYKQLRDRKIILDNAGSIAEAALQLNGVFEAAQAAAQQYLDSLAYLNEQQEALWADSVEEPLQANDAHDVEETGIANETADIPEQLTEKETGNEQEETSE